MAYSKEEITAAKNLKWALLAIAKDLDDYKSTATGVKIAANVVSVISTVGMMAATAATGGLAAPIAIGCGVAGFASTATVVGVDVVEKIVSAKKLAKAQQYLNAFREICFGVIEVHKGAMKMVGATRALKSVVKGTKKLKALNKMESAFSKVVSKTGKVMPVLSGIFLVLDVIDIVRLTRSSNESHAWSHALRRIVIEALDDIIYNR